MIGISSETEHGIATWATHVIAFLTLPSIQSGDGCFRHRPTLLANDADQPQFAQQDFQDGFTHFFFAPSL